MRIFAFLGTLIASLFLAASAFATGQPEDWQLGFQPAASPVRHAMDDFHNFLLILITAICVFVLALLLWVMVRYNSKANPTPAKFSHNTMIEVVWTLIPVLIVGTIAVWSYRVLEDTVIVPEADMTIKAQGNQWYWNYTYPDHGDFEYASNMLTDEQLASGEFGSDYFGNERPRLLAVDEDLVVPVGKVIRVQVTAANVLHNFALPAFGLKMDAVPGRLNETWFKVDEPGMYYGQCSEMCGLRHSFMPIAIRAVSQEEFDRWAAQKKAEFAGLDFDDAASSQVAAIAESDDRGAM